MADMSAQLPEIPGEAGNSKTLNPQIQARRETELRTPQQRNGVQRCATGCRKTETRSARRIPQNPSVRPVTGARNNDVVEAVNRWTLIESALVVKTGVGIRLPGTSLAITRGAPVILPNPALTVIRVTMPVLIVCRSIVQVDVLPESL